MEATQEVVDKVYTIIPARLLKIVAAAADEENGLPIESLLLSRKERGETLTACNGHVMVEVSVPADRSLFASGQLAIIPRTLVNSVCKTPIKSDTDVEIVDLESTIQANLPNGLLLECGKVSAGYPSLSHMRKNSADAQITVSIDNLKTFVKAVSQAMPGATKVTFAIEHGEPRLYITADDGVANLFAVIASDENAVVDVASE